MKVRVAGGDAVYALPELPSKQVAPGAHLRRVLGDWVVEVASSANLVVLRTPPGSAHVVGSALDRSGFHGIVGTVAGDDTVLVVASEDVGGKELSARLSEIAGFEEPQIEPAGQNDTADNNTASQNNTGSQQKRRGVEYQARGSRLQRWARHFGRGSLARRRARCRGDRPVGGRRPGGDFEVLRERALRAGAVISEVVDAVGDGRSFVVPAIRPTPSTRASTRSYRHSRGR